jgi:hypothetical protein
MRNRTSPRWLAVGIFLVLCGCNHSGNSNNSANSSNPSSPDATATTGTTTTATTNAPVAGSTPGTASAPTPAPAPLPPPVVIDVGTTLTVTIDQTVGTKTNNTGDRFAASLAEPVTVNGNQVLPTGTKATGTLVQADSAGHVKGGAVLALTLDSLTINGMKYSIETSQYEQTIKSRGKRTAVGAGGGAAFGAIVGALAGGGKGAAIGALAGGGAGTAGAAYTGQRDITIPAETRLHFKLKKPLTL